MGSNEYLKEKEKGRGQKWWRLKKDSGITRSYQHLAKAEVWSHSLERSLLNLCLWGHRVKKYDGRTQWNPAIKNISRLEERNLDLELHNDVRWNLIGVKIGGNAATRSNQWARHQKGQPRAGPYTARLLKEEPKVWPEEVTLPMNGLPLIEPASIYDSYHKVVWLSVQLQIPKN